jgi:hypothetical protein
MKNGIDLMQIEIEELFIEGSRPVEAMITRFGRTESGSLGGSDQQRSMEVKKYG